jgi:uncharacterized protein YdeI (YjbR/CyaY-like superfamily)
MGAGRVDEAWVTSGVMTSDRPGAIVARVRPGPDRRERPDPKGARARIGDLEVRHFGSAAVCEQWFEDEHERSPGIWIRFAKRGGQAASVSYAEAIEIALCFGWIDGRKETLDDQFWLQRFTPRRSQSPWSKINRVKAEGLTKEGRMRAAGLRAIELAKADGRWAAAYESQSRAAVPPDLDRALRANPAARAFFATIASHNRYAILYRVHAAKKPETRARRIATYVAMLAEGKTLHPDSRSAGKAGKAKTAKGGKRGRA